MPWELPTLALTAGDAAGIGPEVLIKAIVRAEVATLAHMLILGDARVLRREIEQLGLPVPIVRVGTVPAVDEWVTGSVCLLDVPVHTPVLPVYGELAATCGDAAVRAVELASDLALAGKIAGIVTAPLNKEAMRLAAQMATTRRHNGAIMGQ